MTSATLWRRNARASGMDAGRPVREGVAVQELVVPWTRPVVADVVRGGQIQEG